MRSSVPRISKHDPVYGPADPDALRRDLLDWFAVSGRDLPWRRRPSLYGTWVSEMMLQQTTVQTVIPYWHRFMERFPDAAALAAADRDEVLALWSGLGYYRRARALHDAAGIVTGELGGSLPRDREGWSALPGVGAYASGAIASIGLGETVPALDANARRVLTRWAVGDPAQLGEFTPRRLETLGADLVDPARPGDWNEAVMELGALICRAGKPDCPRCPVRGHCRAHAAGQVHDIPPPKRREPTVPVQLGVLVLARKDQYLLAPPGSAAVEITGHGPDPVRRDFAGLHRGLWGVPMTTWFKLEDRGQPSWDPAVWSSWLAELAFDGQEVRDRLRHLGRFTHAITKYRLRVEVYGALLPPDFQLPPGVRPGARSAGGEHKFISGSPEGRGPTQTPVFARYIEAGLPISKLTTKALQTAQTAFG